MVEAISGVIRYFKYDGHKQNKCSHKHIPAQTTFQLLDKKFGEIVFIKKGYDQFILCKNNLSDVENID